MINASPREVLLRHGRWIGASDFAKLVADKRGVSERHAKTLISKAYSDGEIKKHNFPDRTVIYGLAEFGPPTSEPIRLGIGEPEVERVRKALEELRCEFKFFIEPTAEQVACRAGKLPTVVEPVLYALANDTGWEPQENPEGEAQHAINVAGWLIWGESKDQDPKMQTIANKEINKASKSTLRRAQMIAQNYPTLAAKVSFTQIVWQEETKSKWTEIFNSKDPSPFYKTSEGFMSSKELANTPAYRSLLRTF